MRRVCAGVFASSVLLVAVAVAPARAQESGTIDGRVRVASAPPQRVADRYAGGGGAVPHEMVEIPAVAYVLGDVPGSAGRGTGSVLAQRDTAFQPPLVVVPIGATVRFPNEDAFFHNVFSYSRAKRFDLGRYPRGESRTVTFDRAGLVEVFCEIHKWMRAVVLVAENPYYAIVDDDGRFRIGGVPPGRYRVAVWHADRGRKVVEVEVAAGRTAQVDVAF